MKKEKMTERVKKSKDERGEVSIEIIVKMMLAMFLIYMFLQIAPLFTINMHLAQASETLARTVELTGCTQSPEYQAQLAKYQSDLGFPFTITIVPEDPTGGWFNQSQGKLKFRQQFTLTMTATHHVNIINIRLSELDGPGIDIPITKKVYGTSEIYWKA